MTNITINMVSESEISVRGHGVHTAFVEMTQALGRRKDCTVIINRFFKRTSADIIHLHTVGFYSFLKLLIEPGPKVISAHIVPDSLVGSLVLARFWLPLARTYLGMFYRRGDHVLAVSKSVADILHDELRVPRGKITVLYNSIDTTRYKATSSIRKKARIKHAIAEDDFVVVGSGQVQPRKRFDVFVACAKALPEMKFVWVGGMPFKYAGAHYQEMQRMIDAIPKNMQVTGVIELEDVKEYLWLADALLFPSEQETFGLSILEAAAAGVPLVLRDIHDYDDTFGASALLARSDQEFIDHLISLKSDAALKKKYSEKSLALAARFDSEVATETLVGIYRKLLRGAKKKVSTV